MPLAQILADFQADAAQCDNLIANAHQNNLGGASLLPKIDQQQITVAAYLNLFVAWESFLEFTIAELMTGATTINGTLPVRYAIPPTKALARNMLIGTNRYFDYANHEFVLKIVNLYFQGGYPFENHLSSAVPDLADMRIMRNSSAHISSTTQVGLQALALRLIGPPPANIKLYDLLMANVPGKPGQTVYTIYRDKLLALATVIATG